MPDDLTGHRADVGTDPQAIADLTAATPVNSGQHEHARCFAAASSGPAAKQRLDARRHRVADRQAEHRADVGEAFAVAHKALELEYARRSVVARTS